MKNIKNKIINFLIKINDFFVISTPCVDSKTDKILRQFETKDDFIDKIAQWRNGETHQI